MTAWEEYTAATDPTNENSVLSIVNIQRQNATTLHVFWKGGTAARQFVECNEDPWGQGTWRVVFTNPPPTLISPDFTHSGATNSDIYYRIRAERTD
jgi:hypothetical protein